MDDRVIICISREFGSGGRMVGEELAKRLGIICYDKELLAKTAVEHGISEELITGADEKPISWSAMGFPMGLRNPYLADIDALYYTINDRIFDMQAKTIRAIASEGSCVIVGRVAEKVLEDDPDMISIFINGHLEDRIKRIMAIKNIGYQEAALLVRKTDKSRADYHNNYSKSKWGKCSSYDLSLSTSRFGIDGVVNAIFKIIK